MSNNKIKILPTEKLIKLEADKKYIFNPGGIGVYYGIPRSFIVYDSENKTVKFYRYEELIDKSNKVNLAVSFDERWMPDLCSDEIAWFLKYAKDDSKTIRENFPAFSNIADMLSSFDNEKYHKVGKNRKKEYIKEFSDNLAWEIYDLTKDLTDEFDFPNPLEVREHYLKLPKKSI